MSTSYLPTKIIITIMSTIKYFFFIDGNITAMSMKEEVPKCISDEQLDFGVCTQCVHPNCPQSIEECLPVEGPACGMTRQHSAVSVVAVAAPQ